jgi:uncharacterized protein (TIGR00730 family)
MSATDSSPNRNNAVSLADEEAVKEVLVNSVLGLWDVVNNLTRLKPSRRDRYRVTIFGSARAKPGTIAYEETKRAAKLLADLGCDIVTGGGPGLMQAANEGVDLAGNAKSLGIRVDLPFEQEVNPFVELAFEHRTFFTRLHHFVLASDAFIVAPGGIGTVLETMMIWQLLQVRHLERTPLILVGKLWPGLVDWVRNAMLSFDTPLINAEDVDIPKCVANVEEAIEIIKQHREQWATQNNSKSQVAR